jgi:hypothetical protein
MIRSGFIAAAALAAAIGLPLAATAQDSSPSLESIMASVHASVEQAGIGTGAQGVFIADAIMINSTDVDFGSNGGAAAADSDQQGAAMASNQ